MLDDWVGLVVVGGDGYGVNATDGGSVHIYICTDVRGRDRGQWPGPGPGDGQLVSGLFRYIWREREIAKPGFDPGTFGL